MFSPAVCRVGPGDWRMWLINDAGPCHVYTAADALGPWSGPTDLTFAGTADGGVPGLWHGDIIRTADGVFRFIVNAPFVATGPGSTLYAASSRDGVAWSGWSAPVIEHRPTEWDARLYRATLVEESGTVLRCWYSAYGTDAQPRIGHTRLPLVIWPDPPAADA